MNLNKHVESASKFIHEVAEELGQPNDIDKAWRVLRTTLHVLRMRLTQEESFDLIAELPMFIKALYVDGWDPKREQPRIKTIDDFVDTLLTLHGRGVANDLPNHEAAEDAATAVFHVLQKHISLGESENVRAILPKELKHFWMPGAA